MVLLQRDFRPDWLVASKADRSVILIRFFVGMIFVIESVLKFMRPEALGAGRFAKVDIPFATLTANLDGAFEIGCGALILVGLATRLAVLPMIVDMVGALTTTKVAIFWGGAPLYKGEHGLWDFLHESRLEWAMLCGSLYLLIVGSGGWSIDGRLAKRSG